MLIFDGPRQHDDIACAARHQRKPSLCRVHVGQRPKHRAKPPDFDSQPPTMRFIGEPRSECPRNEHVPRHVSGPRFAQRAYKSEQHRTSCQRDHLASVAHQMTARVHHQRFRRQQCFHFSEQESPLLATRNQAGRRRVQDQGGTFDLRRQRRDTCEVRGAFRSSESGTGRVASETTLPASRTA